VRPAACHAWNVNPLSQGGESFTTFLLVAEHGLAAARAAIQRLPRTFVARVQPGPTINTQPIEVNHQPNFPVAC
jgi:hypothetical protein